MEGEPVLAIEGDKQRSLEGVLGELWGSFAAFGAKALLVAQRSTSVGSIWVVEPSIAPASLLLVQVGISARQQSRAFLFAHILQAPVRTIAFL